jgi:type II secretory pathway pseudopilin PulG
MRLSRRRDGVAIFVVVMVCVIVGVLVSVVFFQGRDARRKSAEKRDQVQARFLARAAQNHFLLKFRLLPSELYDAVSYAVGKNPYFDFNLKVATVSGNTFAPAPGAFTDAGPMFFTGDGTTVSENGGRFSIVRPSGDAVYANGRAGFDASPTNRPRMEYLLNHYILDVATGHPSYDADAVVLVSSEPHRDAAQMGKADTAFERPRPAALWADPFNGTYIVRSVKILGSGGTGAASAGKRFEADSVLLTTEASVQRDGQVSPVARTANGLKRLVVQREVATAIDGESGTLELREKTETDEEYNRRVLDMKSARRSEVMTAVYLVTRKKAN